VSGARPIVIVLASGDYSGDSASLKIGAHIVDCATFSTGGFFVDVVLCMISSEELQ
jgi:hypothetical protein